MAREAGRFVGISGFDQSAQALDRRASGDGVKLLQDGEFVDSPDQSVRALAPGAPFPRLVGHGLPAIVARGVQDKELVDAGGWLVHGAPLSFSVSPRLVGGTGDLL